MRPWYDTIHLHILAHMHKSSAAHLQGGHGGFHHVGQEVADVLHLCALQVVVGRVLQQAPVEEGPGEVVYRVLLGAYCARHHLSIEVVRHLSQPQQSRAAETVIIWTYGPGWRGAV